MSASDKPSAGFFNFAGERAADGGEIDDAFLGHLEGGDATYVRLDLAHGLRAEAFDALQTVLHTALLELFHAVDLSFVDGHD